MVRTCATAMLTITIGTIFANCGSAAGVIGAWTADFISIYISICAVFTISNWSLLWRHISAVCYHLIDWFARDDGRDQFAANLFAILVGDFVSLGALAIDAVNQDFCGAFGNSIVILGGSCIGDFFGNNNILGANDRLDNFGL